MSVLRIRLRCKLKVLPDTFWAFPWTYTVTFYFLAYQQLFFNALVFTVWLQKGEKVKTKGGGGRRQSWKSPRNHFSQRGRSFQLWVRCNNGCLTLCPHLCDQKQLTSSQSRDLQYLEDKVLFAYPGSLKLCKSCFQKHVHSLLQCCYCATSWNWSKLTTKSVPRSCKPSTDFEVPK